MGAVTKIDIPSNPYERASWVRHELRVRGKSFTSLARKLGVSRQAITQALYAPSAPAERALARALGVPVTKLFPERFAADGRRRHEVKNTPRVTTRNVEKRPDGAQPAAAESATDG